MIHRTTIAVAVLAACAALPLAAKAQSYAGTPYTGSATLLPATLAAVNFDKGGEGVAYHDLSSGNLGGVYRTSESVDIYASSDTASGPYQVANFQTGEWMTYTVNVPANGTYDVGIRAANNYGTGAFHMEVDGVNVTGTIAVAKTGSWNTYQWFGKKGVALSAGTHVVRLVSEQQWFNVSALTLLASSTTGTGTTSGDPAAGSTPYTGTAVSLPANVAAVNFDKGGEGVAYHDLSSGNLGGLYRASESVDIYASTDSASGPYQVANFQTGEWMKYTVNVPANGTYDVGIRAANNYGTGAFHIEVDGANVTGAVPVPKTGGWSTYQWFGKKGVALTAGTHVVRLVSDQQWFNVSALSMQASSTSGTGTPTGSAGSTPISHDYLVLSPKASTSPNETHATMVVSRASFTNVRFSGGVQTIKQLRTGSAPNPWETAWVVFGYTDDLHYYYLAFKTNGWELGKVDPAYPGAQRYLADTSSPSFSVGSQHWFNIQQDNSVISVSIDGKPIATFTDYERPYLSGKIGFYTEDATVAFDNVSGSMFEDFESYPLQTFTADGSTLGTNWEAPYVGYGYGAIRSDGTAPAL